jgi:hypothetical protein
MSHAKKNDMLTERTISALLPLKAHLHDAEGLKMILKASS